MFCSACAGLAGILIETSNVLLDRPQHGTLDFMIGRVFDTIDTTGLIYEELTEEPACTVVRPSHPMLENKQLALKDIAPLPWILPPHGIILRYRYDMMFRREGPEPPSNVVDTTAVRIITALLQETDSLHVMPLEVARYYASLNLMRILPIELSCKMDAIGIIRQRDHLFSPGANLLLQAVRAAATEIY